MPSIGPISGVSLLDEFVGPLDPRLALSNAVAVANTAYLSRFQVLAPHVVTLVRFAVNIQSGNVDIGIYDAAGNRLGSTGSTAVPVGGARSINLTAPVTLYPGQWYYAALALDNATAIIVGSAPANGGLAAAVTPPVNVGVATSFPLPNPIVVGTSGITRTFAVLYE